MVIARVRPWDRITLLVMLAGCDAVFQLHRNDVDATGDGPRGEMPCSPVLNDEDNDGADDGCDNCPWVGDRSFIDMDRDQVGDECDPRPTIGGDTQVDFVSFTEANPRTRWDGNVTDWNFIGGALRFDRFGGSSVIKDTPGRLPRAFIVVAHVVIDALPTGPEYSRFAIVANVSGVDEEGVMCLLARNTSNRQYAAAFDPFDGPAGTSDDAVIPILPDAGYLFRFTYDPNGGEATCDVQRDNGGPRVAPSFAPKIVQASPRLGFEGLNIRAHIDFVATYLR